MAQVVLGAQHFYDIYETRPMPVLPDPQECLPPGFNKYKTNALIRNFLRCELRLRCSRERMHPMVVHAHQCTLHARALHAPFAHDGRQRTSSTLIRCTALSWRCDGMETSSTLIKERALLKQRMACQGSIQMLSYRPLCF